jgi:hypothetical protein
MSLDANFEVTGEYTNGTSIYINDAYYDPSLDRLMTLSILDTIWLTDFKMFTFTKKG